MLYAQLQVHWLTFYRAVRLHSGASNTFFFSIKFAIREGGNSSKLFRVAWTVLKTKIKAETHAGPLHLLYCQLELLCEGGRKLSNSTQISGAGKQKDVRQWIIEAFDSGIFFSLITFFFPFVTHSAFQCFIPRITVDKTVGCRDLAEWSSGSCRTKEQ